MSGDQKNSGGSGTVPAGLPQGETEGFYMIHDVIHNVFDEYNYHYGNANYSYV